MGVFWGVSGRFGVCPGILTVLGRVRTPWSVDRATRLRIVLHGGQVGGISGSWGVLVWFWKIWGVPGTPDRFEARWDATVRGLIHAGAHSVALGVHKHAAG